MPDPGGAYTNWEQAAVTIQDAVNAAAVNDTVWVGAGHYDAPTIPSNCYGPSVVVISRAITLRSSNGVPDSTIIDGGGLYRGLAIRTLGNTTNVFVVDGFTFTNGWSTKALITDCVFQGNRELRTAININNGGGVMYASNGRHTFRNTLMYNNGTAGNSGGALYTFVSSGGDPSYCVLTLINCTLVGHSVGGGIHARRSNWTLTVSNSIVYSNVPNFTGNAASMGPGGAVTNLFIYYSCTVTNGLSGTFPASNTTNNPAFVNDAANDFQLSPGSPCINTGTNQAWMNEALDLDKHARLDRFSGKADMGCYEYQPRSMTFKLMD